MPEKDGEDEVQKLEVHLLLHFRASTSACCLNVAPIPEWGEHKSTYYICKLPAVVALQAPDTRTVPPTFALHLLHAA